jgi:segregation and condensation protein B
MEPKRVIEAILFCSTDPVSIDRLRRVLPRQSPTALREELGKLAREYEDEGRSFQLIEVAGGYQLTTKPEYVKAIGKFFRRKKTRLSHASLETVTIVAYKQPATRAEIERVRGVSVDTVLDTLLDRNLIKVSGRAKKPGGPLLYSTTKEFLRYFGLRSLADLPKSEALTEENSSPGDSPDGS